MALTLPYPDMNFVPLDVLTAAEQNQLVANIEYIADQFPITSDNIDFTTLLPSIVFGNNKAFPTAASDTPIYGDEITVPVNGRYFAYVSAATAATGNSGVLFVYINKNGSNQVNTQHTTRNQARVSGDVGIMLTLNAGDKIKGGFYGNTALGSLDGTVLTLFMIRIS